MTKILPPDEVKHLQEKDQCSIFVQDTAVQVSPGFITKLSRDHQKLHLWSGMESWCRFSLIGSFNLGFIKSSKSSVKKLQTFVDKYDVPLGLFLQRYELWIWSTQES